MVWSAEICYSILDLLILLCPSSLASAPKASPSFSPSVPSPADEPRGSTGVGVGTGRDAQKDKTAFSLGVPHSLALGGIAARTEQDLTQVKIRLRAMDRPSARSFEEVAGGHVEDEPKRKAARWRGSERGFVELESKRTEVREEDEVRRREEEVSGERSREREKERQRARRPVSVRYLF